MPVQFTVREGLAGIVSMKRDLPKGKEILRPSRSMYHQPGERLPELSPRPHSIRHRWRLGFTTSSSRFVPLAGV